MNPRQRIQKIFRCYLCKTPDPLLCCKICQLKLCKACVGEHLSDFSKKHNVIQFKQLGLQMTSPKCSETEALEKELTELKERIYPKYEEILSDLNSDEKILDKHYKKLKREVTSQGEVLRGEIDRIVEEMKTEITYMKNQHKAALMEYEDKIRHEMSEIKQTILDLQKILDANDVSLASSYKSRIAGFEQPVSGIQIELPCLNAIDINPEQLYQQFGSFSKLSITNTELGYIMKTPEGRTCPVSQTLLDDPKLLSTIDTGYNYLFSVTCLDDETIITCGNTNIIKLYDLKGILLKSIETKSGRTPCDIAIKRQRKFVYTDTDDGTINILKNDQIQDVIRVQGWKPHQVCSTLSDDLLVAMVCNENSQSKVARYSGSTEKQSIQFDDKGNPLFSSFGGNHHQYIAENKNLDICVADCEGHAVVVVSHAGKLRFRYTGQFSYMYRSFCPFGIATDSHSHILLAEHESHCIHIIDKDGQFLSYIANCVLNFPYGLCVDTNDNLFVAERDGKVKKIKYM